MSCKLIRPIKRQVVPSTHDHYLDKHQKPYELSSGQNRLHADNSAEAERLLKAITGKMHVDKVHQLDQV